MTAPARPPTFEDVMAAVARLNGEAVRTPVLRSPELDARVGAPVLMKAETFQTGGAFKFRGAYNRLRQLTADQRARGVVAYSSGNHAQGVALAARALGIAATIVMPADAPARKLANTRAYGAVVTTYDRETESREQIAASLAGAHGATLVPPFDDPDIIAGQGTCGVEFVEQAAQLGVRLDSLYMAASGGGLAAGMALAFERLSPATRLFTVEPAGFDDHRRSLEAGTRKVNAPGGQTICDALRSPSPGELTFAINRGRLAGGLTVDDRQVARAVAFAWRQLDIVVEPGGAAALAAVLAGLADGDGPIGLVLSGGNIDEDLFALCLRQWPTP